MVTIDQAMRGVAQYADGSVKIYAQIRLQSLAE